MWPVALVLCVLSSTVGTAPERSDAREPALVRRIEALLARSSAHSPTVSADGKSIYFVSNIDGIERLYVRSVEDPQATRVDASWPDRMNAATVSADGQWVIIPADRDGDEMNDMYGVFRNDGKVRQLTRTRLARDPPVAPAAEADAFYYSTREPSSAHGGIARLQLSADAAPVEKAVYTDAGLGFLNDVSGDGKRALFVRYVSHQSSMLLLVDLEKGASRPLYPIKGESTIRTALFARDGKTVYLATDGGAEQALVLAIDTKSGRESARYTELAPATAAGEQLLLSRDGAVLAVAFNAGDHSVFRLLDSRDLRAMRSITLPLGSGSLGDFSIDARRLLVDWATPQHPHAIYEIDVESGKPAPLDPVTKTSMSAVDVTIERIRSADGVEFPVNVYRPTRSGKVPVIVDFHGGPAGWAPIAWSPTARLANELGIAYVTPNIRGSGGFRPRVRRAGRRQAPTQRVQGHRRT